MDLTNFSVNNLNKSQKEAVVHYQTPLLILAGAGTGKTLTITMRIAYLIKAGITNPDNILAVTFTNKAANEMKNRISAFVGEDANRMWVGTFHGISAKILRIYASAVGLSPNFTIIDEDDRKKIIQNTMNDLNIDEKRFPIKQITWILQQLRQNCVDPNDSVKLANYDRRDLDVGELYRNYTNRLMSMNLVDFDSLIYLCIVLFRKNPVILSDMQRRFQYITVDEYQDTNFAQHLWLQILASAGANVCCVGDDDQSIYSWRGAYVDYILNFEKDFLGAKIIRLEDNYRSNQSVLNAAMSVISHNKQRYSKSLHSGIKSAFEPTLYIVGNDKEEGALLSKHVQVLKNNGVNYRNIAVLVRATHQMLNIEDYFIKNKIAYNIIGGIKFYERKEIKDLIAYLQFANTLDNEIALSRIINVPKRGIGDKSYEDIVVYTKKNGWMLFDGLENIASFGGVVSPKISESLRKFNEFIKNIHNHICDQKSTIQDIIEKIYFESGYSDMLQAEKQKDPSIDDKIDNIREFISFAKDFDTLDQFLEHISLSSAVDDTNEEDAVSIMTMHSAKGLEFDYVFLPGWDDCIFPSRRSISESGESGLEEERRLAYVALTRAKNNFFVYSCKQRLLFGRLEYCMPSVFISEMRDQIKVEDNSTYRNSINSNTTRSNSISSNTINRNIASGYGKLRSSTRDREASIKINSGYKKSWQDEGIQLKQTNKYVRIEEEENESFAIGDKVGHAKFGTGTIKGMYGKFCEVKLEDGKTRVIPATELEKIK